MNMMKIETIVGDIVLLVLNNHDPLQKVGINEDKIFVKIKGYDENGIWIHHPSFNRLLLFIVAFQKSKNP